MSQAQCRRNSLELAHILIYYLQCTLCIIHTCTKDHYQKKDATDEPQSFENHINIYLCTTYTYTTYSGITQAINHLVTSQWNETYDVRESTHSQQFSIIF